MIKINLLPYRSARKKEIITKQVFIGALPLLATCLIIGFLWLSINAETNQVSQDIVTVQEKIKQSTLKMKDIENFKAQKETLSKKMDVIKTLQKNKSGPVRMLDDIATCLPGNVWLTKIDQKETGVLLEGIGLDNLSISRYMVQLEGSSSLSDVTLGEIKTATKTASQGGKILKNFKLQSTVVYNPDAVAPSS
jgi:type IV pilus assembly protein PilN